jgi:uncharacterized protein with PQ loop repeat
MSSNDIVVKNKNPKKISTLEVVISIVGIFSFLPISIFIGTREYNVDSFVVPCKLNSGRLWF